MDSKIAPSGSTPLGHREDEGQAMPEEQATEQTQTEKSSDPDWKTQYEELRQAYGRMGNELGSTRQKMAEMEAAIAKQGSPAKENKTSSEANDFDAQMAKIYKDVDDGEITMGEGLAKVAKLTQKHTLDQANQQFQQFSQEKDAAQAVREFRKANPTFDQVRQTPEFRSLQENNPLLAGDDFSTFLEFQRLQATTQANTYQQQIADLTKRLELAEGAKATAKVVSKPGSGMQAGATPPPKRDGGNIDEAMAVIARLRNANA
jgi:hypothetical protein